MSKALLAAVVLAASVLALPAAGDVPEGAAPKVAASLNGDPYGERSRGEEEARQRALKKPAARPTATHSRDCTLSADEELLVSELRTAMARLEQRRLALDAREAAVMALKEQVARQLEELVSVQRAITSDLEVADRDRRSDRQTRIVQLAGIIKKMKPDEAAGIVGRQDLDVAVKILDSLGARQAGKILAKLPPEHAVRIAERLVALPVGVAAPSPDAKEVQ